MKRRYAEWLLVLAGLASIVTIWTVCFRSEKTDERPLPFETRRRSAESCDAATEERLRATVREAGLEAIPILLDQIRQEKAPLTKTVTALSSLGPPALPRLLAYFDNPNDDIRLVAVRTVSNLALALDPQAAAASADHLISRMSDPNLGIRYVAILTLTNLRTSREGAIPALIATLQDSLSSSNESAILIEASAVFLLGEIGPKAKSAIPLLDVILSDKDSPARAVAGIALWRITHDTNFVSIRLSKMLEETNSSGQLHAEAILRRISHELESSACSSIARQ